jgi:hypothetical protein
VRVSNINIAGSIHGDARGRIEQCAGCRSAIASEALFSRPRDRGDDAGDGDLADRVVIKIRNVQIACGIVGNARRRVQRRRSRLDIAQRGSLRLSRGAAHGQGY